ncbi:FixH family protein [Rhodoflexus sp.]
MKFHWGHGVVVSFVLFVAMIGYMVAVAMRSDVLMVSKDYYRQEENFNAHAEAVGHAREAGNLLRMEQTATEVTFVCPKEWVTQSEGEIYFYRPSDAKLDFRVAFTPDEEGKQYIHTEPLAKGYWRAKLQIKAAGRSYFKDYAFQVK